MIYEQSIVVIDRLKMELPSNVRFYSILFYSILWQKKVWEWAITFPWTPWNLSFHYINCTGQFTPKMKANTEPHLLSSLVWIDSGVVVSQNRLESFFMKLNVTECQVSWNTCLAGLRCISALIRCERTDIAAKLGTKKHTKKGF